MEKKFLLSGANPNILKILLSDKNVITDDVLDTAYLKYLQTK